MQPLHPPRPNAPNVLTNNPDFFSETPLRSFSFPIEDSTQEPAASLQELDRSILWSTRNPYIHPQANHSQGADQQA